MTLAQLTGVGLRARPYVSRRTRHIRRLQFMVLLAVGVLIAFFVFAFAAGLSPTGGESPARGVQPWTSCAGSVDQGVVP